MSAKHTPGPWMYYTGTRSIWAEGQRRAICIMTGARKTADMERDANAHLIAAAPDLLAALLDIVAIDDGDISALWPYCDLFDNARDAIAKAVGEPAFNGAGAKTMKATGEAA